MLVLRPIYLTRPVVLSMEPFPKVDFTVIEHGPPAPLRFRNIALQSRCCRSRGKRCGKECNFSIILIRDRRL
jgi:hypothetical protein